jgi:hypothetical protein
LIKIRSETNVYVVVNAAVNPLFIGTRTQKKRGTNVSRPSLSRVLIIAQLVFISGSAASKEENGFRPTF